MASDNFVQQSANKNSRIHLSGFVVGIGLCVVLCCFWSTGALDRPQQRSQIELDGRINPNLATVSSLVRLPAIGPARATAIVDYRQDYEKGQMTGRAFENVNDLQKVRGIGPKTARNLANWLKFE